MQIWIKYNAIKFESSLIEIIGRFLIGVTEKLVICTCMQSFDSVAPHLELAILSRKLRITEHVQ